MDSQFSLLKTSRFLPLFIVQFLGAFNDNLLKTVVVVMIAYGLWDVGGLDPGVLVAIAAALFIFPFVLFCPLAGNLSDKYDKAMMVRRIKLAEIVIALAAVGALFSGSLYFAFAILLALGAQSAFFSPIKFSILPQHLKPEELVGGNGLVSTGTYLAILGGTILGALLAPLEHAKAITSAVVLIVAIAGYVAARLVPPAPPPDPDLDISYNIVGKAYGVVCEALKQPAGVLVGILGTAWFYFVAATFHAQFPNFTKQALGVDNLVLSIFMVAFSVGIAVGGLLNHKILKAKAHGGFVPLSCLFIAVFGVDLYFAAKAYPMPMDGTLHDLGVFASNVQGLRLIADTFLLSVAGGFFVVPLRAIVQRRTHENVRGRVISSSNMMEALFILMSAVYASVALSFGVSIEGLYLGVSLASFFVGLWLFKIASLRANHQA